ncbi:hypothetical protein ACFSKX_03290 [Microbulbifer halophilus]|uniref:Uncharacterized protein n=2 Tax=Microbulbifer halophilus TaxID=453963 RepID=A0ABW5E7I1_9GAMM
MAETPKESDHTSIKRRIRAARKTRQPGRLLPFAGNPRKSIPEGIPAPLDNYLELMNWSGRFLREGKRAAIDENLSPILDSLQIDPRH